MTENKYNYIIKHPVFKKTDYGTEVIFRGNDNDAMDADIQFCTIKKPASIDQPEETKGYNRFGVFLNADPKAIPDFRAVAEITLGEEAETQVVNSTTVYHIPADMPVKAINFRKVDSPVVFMSLYVPPEKG